MKFDKILDNNTLRELNKMESVRNFLINEGAIDADGLVDYLAEIQ